MSERGAAILGAAIIIAALLNGVCGLYQLAMFNGGTQILRMNRLTGTIVVTDGTDARTVVTSPAPIWRVKP